jgi:hypothetical protein
MWQIATSCPAMMWSSPRAGSAHGGPDPPLTRLDRARRQQPRRHLHPRCRRPPTSDAACHPRRHRHPRHRHLPHRQPPPRQIRSERRESGGHHRRRLSRRGGTSLGFRRCPAALLERTEEAPPPPSLPPRGFAGSGEAEGRRRRAVGARCRRPCRLGRATRAKERDNLVHTPGLKPAFRSSHNHNSLCLIFAWNAITPRLGVRYYTTLLKKVTRSVTF